MFNGPVSDLLGSSAPGWLPSVQDGPQTTTLQAAWLMCSFHVRDLSSPPPAYYLVMHSSGASGFTVPGIYHVGECEGQ